MVIFTFLFNLLTFILVSCLDLIDRDMGVMDTIETLGIIELDIILPEDLTNSASMAVMAMIQVDEIELVRRRLFSVYFSSNKMIESHLS